MASSVASLLPLLSKPELKPIQTCDKDSNIAAFKRIDYRLPAAVVDGCWIRNGGVRCVLKVRRPNLTELDVEFKINEQNSCGCSIQKVLDFNA